ncbi:XRE family transcriptional regulator [Corynebacterium diphtheriae subsp. lausannense]|nr:XRE family transcriptional regulator [Corynebacterium diphtheriae subsp. lausannense]
MQSTRWWDYITGIIGDSTYSQAATKAGFDKSAFTRWKKGARADPDFVVKIARAYDANVLEALVAAGFITEAEAKLQEIKVGGITLNDASNQQLLDEIMHRLTPEANRLSGDPTGENIDYQQRDDLAKRRHTTPETPPHVQDYPYDAVADSSPDEEEGDDHDYYA